MQVLLTHIAIIFFCCFFSLLFLRIIILKKRGINPIAFGKTNKGDFLLLPIVALFLYIVVASSFGPPFSEKLIIPLFQSSILFWIGFTFCTIGLIGFGIALRDFGKSFRIGIDKEKADKLITNGIFAISRNPIYASFLVFFLGITFIHPNIAILLFVFGFFFPVIHRQTLREERFMERHYGKEYELYCAKTRRYL